MNYNDIRFARLPFTQNGEEIHTGQAFYLRPGPNTVLMEDFEFFYSVDEIKREFSYGAPFECGECGKQFITDRLRREHITRYHRRPEQLSQVDPKNYYHASGRQQDEFLDVDEKLTSNHLRALVSRGKVAGNLNAYPKL